MSYMSAFTSSLRQCLLQDAAKHILVELVSYQITVNEKS